jgi:O-antigen ligase
VTERIPKGALVGGAILAPFFLALLAYAQPGYFSSQTYLAGLLLLELLFAALWMYRQVFFPLILIAFLFAGTGLAVGGGWTVARWVFLGFGAGGGCVIMFKERSQRFSLFHIVALFAVLAATVSAAVSRYPDLAILKALSLLLLFVYAATGARLAVAGREPRFFSGLLVGCEIFVGVIAVSYMMGREVMGNPNSLGAVMGVACAPILLWGTLLKEKSLVHNQRLAMLAVCFYLVFYSHSRAGIVATLFSCGLMCFALRKFKVFAQGLGAILILVAAYAIVQPAAFSNLIAGLTSSVVYKGHDPTLGVLASRESPWQAAVESITSNFWFGTGFGTADNGKDIAEGTDRFSTSQGVTTENGSSYLAIVEWVGILGVLPFLFLVLAIVGKTVRTVRWMLSTGNPSHPAVPLAMVLVAGLIHAAFEDWLFAPGYYLCVFFWSLAFVLVDVAPKPLPDAVPVRPWLFRQSAGSVAPRA